MDINPLKMPKEDVMDRKEDLKLRKKEMKECEECIDGWKHHEIDIDGHPIEAETVCKKCNPENMKLKQIDEEIKMIEDYEELD